MALEFFQVQLRVIVFIRRELLYHVRQRGEFQLKSQILDRLSEPQNCQIDCLFFCDARRVASILNLSEALHVLRHTFPSLLLDLGEIANPDFSSL